MPPVSPARCIPITIRSLVGHGRLSRAERPIPGRYRHETVTGDRAVGPPVAARGRDRFAIGNGGTRAKPRGNKRLVRPASINRWEEGT
ncbi:hypothetical protein BRD01_13265 [Halobacteriales archaeon QS_8_65_32]|nr:MAG: hypothetical protein BRD01_13265 [Halobacteriales archaeon QS_8_65_32]